MSLKNNLLMFGGGFALCLAIVVPLMTKWNQPEELAVPKQPAHNDPRPAASLSGNKQAEGAKSRKGWATSLAPFYTVGIFVYVLYVVYKITTRRNAPLNPTQKLSGRGKAKNKITQYELGQLETKLAQSEKAVENILEKARAVMTEVYNKELNESSLSDTSESDVDEAKIKEIGTSTTSSANDDTHQDSTSSGEDVTPHHHRKMHRRSKRSFEKERSSSDEAESGVFPRKGDPDAQQVSDRGSGSSVADEYISTNHDLSDFASESCESSEVGKGATGGERIEEVERSVVMATSEVGNAGDAPALGGDNAKKNIVVEENKELLKTTRQVLTAMEEIREYIKEQKE